MGKIYKLLVAIIFFIVVLSGCGSVPVGENSAREITDTTKSIFYTKSASLPEYPGMEIETIVFKGSKYGYSVRLPKLQAEHWDREMDRLAGRVIDDFLKQTENRAASERNDKLRMDVDFQIYTFSEKYVSIKFEQSLTSADGEGRKTFYTYNYDRNTNQFIQLADFFKDGANYLKKLADFTSQKLSNNGKIKEIMSEEQLNKMLASKETFANFLFKNERLIFLIEAGKTGGATTEPIEVPLTKYELRDVLKKETALGIVNPPPKPKPNNPNNSANPLEPGKKYVALTFDDGPFKTVTPRILDTLAKYNARATFFVLGFRAKEHPELLKRAVAEGHEIGSHSYGHPRFTELSPEKMAEELRKTDEVVANATGKVPAVFRPPYGEYNDTVKATVNKPIITWSVDTRDWEHQNPDMILERVQQLAKNGSIILMHDTLPTTAEGLELVLQWLSEQGYEFVTVSELLGFTANPDLAQPGKVYNSRS